MKDELIKHWNDWDLGGKLIAGSALAAVFSMFLNWFDSGMAQANGFRTTMFILLLLWIYPLAKLWNKRAIDKRIGIALAAISAVLIGIFIADQAHELFGQEVNFAGSGAYICLFASFALGAGVYMHVPPVTDENTAEADAKEADLEAVLAQEHETTDTWPLPLIIKYTFLPKPAGAPKAGQKEIYVRVGVAGFFLLLVLFVF